MLRTTTVTGPVETKGTEIKDEFKNDIADLRAFVGYVKGTETYSIRPSVSPYDQAFTGKGSIIMGRDEDTRKYRGFELYFPNDETGHPGYQGRISGCETEGISWTLTWNRAYWAGGIEARREFVIVSTLRSILERAEFGLMAYDKEKLKTTLGGAFPEIFWLLDNGYRLESRPKITPTQEGVIYAVPPEKPTGREVFIDARYDKYCLEGTPETMAINVAKINSLIVRLKKECDKLEPISRSYQPPAMATLGGGYVIPQRRGATSSSSSGATSSSSSSGSGYSPALHRRVVRTKSNSVVGPSTPRDGYGRKPSDSKRSR